MVRTQLHTVLLGASTACNEAAQCPDWREMRFTFSVGSRRSSPPSSDCTCTGPLARFPAARCTLPRAAACAGLIFEPRTGAPRSDSCAEPPSACRPCEGVALLRSAVACGRAGPRSADDVAASSTIPSSDVACR